ncbi:MAG: type IV-A pilus assembly ATPase PilB [Gammaproteobacteria bacterium]|nr:type IV-A pilus assembly ATPase PilB [Gammaproteobacteria bacterium]
MPAPATSTINILAKRLISDGVLDEKIALQAQRTAQERQMPFITYLVEAGIVTAKTIATAAALDFGLPLIDLASFDKESLPRTLVDEKLINKHRATPLFRRGDRLYVAIADPGNVSALNEFSFHTGLKTYAVLVEENKLAQMIEDSSDQEVVTLGDLSDNDLEAIDINSEPLEEEAVSSMEAEDAPIVRFVHKILLDAIKKGVSDIHLEPYEKVYRIRFRKDGILYETTSPPANLASRIAARIKVMSRLDISERRIPQDGHFNMAITKKHTINFRVSTCPILYGEKIVIRILDPNKLQLSIEQLGYEPEQQALFLKAISRPQGMILVTGPTGSGKTVSLYAALSRLNTVECNISTIEDPVEIQLPGINQVGVNPKAGMDFSTALRAFLRQDPDIIMVGEIRDLETAEIGIKAAQTGHLVLSTLHTNSAPATLARLMNMGVATYNIASSINLIIAQRLVRRLCTHCKQPIEVPNAALYEEGFQNDDLIDLELFTANVQGCEHCKHGYDGRIGIYEVLEVNQAIGHIIMAGGNSMDIAQKGIEQGMQTLRRSGLNKVKLGVTSLDEINRVIKDD